MRNPPSFVVTFCAAAAIATIAAFAGTARGHGFAGDRFFPPTITTDDPFTADELALPTISYFKNPAGDGGPESREVDYGFELDKLIFPRFSLGVSDTYLTQKPNGGREVKGWDNIQLSAKYELIVDDKHEAILSIGTKVDLGGTGYKSIGRDSFTTFTPTLYFGKGFGDLPDSLSAFKPFAVTGLVGQTFPTEAGSPNALEWGFAVEYNLPYLQQHVKDVGLPAPFKDMIPLVEFSMETTENRGRRGLTTGTINPGVLYETPYFQIGAEALIPVNGRSGEHVGGVVQVWVYLDDLFPKYFGRPLFGE